LNDPVSLQFRKASDSANAGQWGDYPIYIPDVRPDIDLYQLPAEEVGVLKLRTQAPGSAIRMKDKLNQLSRRYVAALRKHLGKGVGRPLRPALEIGRRAVALGLETLQLADIHEKALIALKLSPTPERLNKRAQIFFTEALIPFVETHRCTRQSKSDAIRLNKILGRRTAELADSNRLLQKGILRHKTMEATLKKSGAHYVKLLKDSLQLQEGLRQLAHKGLTAQEAERKKISHELQDDVAQLLLSINVRLLSLRRGAQGSTKSVKNQIASTQRLVSQSVKSVREVVSDLDSHQYE